MDSTEQQPPRFSISKVRYFGQKWQWASLGHYIRRGSDGWTRGLLSMWCWEAREAGWLGSEGECGWCKPVILSKTTCHSPTHQHSHTLLMKGSIIFVKSKALILPPCSVCPTNYHRANEQAGPQQLTVWLITDRTASRDRTTELSRLFHGSYLCFLTQTAALSWSTLEPLPQLWNKA